MKLQKFPDKNWAVIGAIPLDVYLALMGLKQLSPFCQSGSPNSEWCMVEFWSGSEALILDLVMGIIPTIEL